MAAAVLGLLSEWAAAAASGGGTSAPVLSPASDDGGAEELEGGSSGSGALMVSGSSASCASPWPAADGAVERAAAVSSGVVSLPGGCQYSGTSGSPLVAQ